MQEAQTEAEAAAFTKALKSATAKFKLWNLYDNVKKSQTPAAQKKAQAALDKAMAKAKAQVAKATK